MDPRKEQSEKPEIRNYREEFKDCLSYIDSYWDKITQVQGQDDEQARKIGLPKPFLVPNSDRFPTMYYWDSYFMAQGILYTNRQQLALDTVGNFTYLFNRFGVIPNAASFDFLHRSQPPFFSSLIMDTYKAMPNKDKDWLAKHIAVAKDEYKTVWTNERDIAMKGLMASFTHRIEGFGLARYGDRNTGHADPSEAESGWDYTSRFASRADQFLPIDLNCLLFKYEQDFVEAGTILDDDKEKSIWLAASEKRKEEINRLMWNEEKGFFYDFDYVHNTQSEFLSLAGFVPMWAGVSTDEQAKRMVQKLASFETEHGLTVTAKESLPEVPDLTNIPPAFRTTIERLLKPKQWDYPQIWPPLEYMTVMGLLRYGFVDDARRIMEKSVNSQANIFRKHGTFFEKRDGVTGDITSHFDYPNQPGFGWTNAVFSRYIDILEKDGD